MKFVRRSWPYVVLVLILAAGGFLLWKHDALLDWAFSRGYHPTSQVQQIATDDTMTATAKRLFYVNRPIIEGRDAFNKHCSSNTADQVSTLGCFTGNRAGIYLYNVTDPRLAGVEQVTAAHEMLHQAYQRLSRSERAHIDNLLQDYYNTGLADQTIRDQLQSYTKSEPGQLVNEMHSIFGTEVAGLPPEIEQYYAQYFTSRAKVVQYYQSYQSAFDQRNKQIKAYDDQLNTLKTQIDAGKAELTNRQKTIESLRSQLDNYRASNQTVAYNNAVPAYNAQVDNYRSEVSTVNSLIDQYNRLLNERNGIAVQEQQLQQALDSHVTNAN